jgi:putative ABC transport system permease protein
MWIWRRRRETELAEEIQAHLRMAAQDRLERGETAPHAAAGARRELGNVGLIQETTRDMWSGVAQRSISQTAQDLRYGWRTYAKSPGFTAVAVLTLALGIGASTAIFSVVNAVLLAPLPYRQADRLITVWTNNPAKNIELDLASGGVFAEWRGRNHVFEGMAASTDNEYTLTGAGDPQFLIGYQFSANYFPLLGVEPQLGRTFRPEEDKPGAPDVVVLSDRLWRRTFHADRRIVGQTITLDGKPYTVVGVMPPGFQYPQMVELWTPLGLDPALFNNYSSTFLRIMARLRPGVSLAHAQTEMSAIQADIARRHPDTNAGFGARLIPIRDMMSGDARTPLFALTGAVAFVLLIACVNVANLLLARASGRQREVALRAALGAARGRLVRQFLAEGALLSALAGTLGLAMAVWAKNAMLALFPKNIANLQLPAIETIPLDARVFLFALLATAGAGIVFGLAPAFQCFGGNLEAALRMGGRGATAGRGVLRLRRAFAVVEISLALVVLAGAGLLIESFRNLMQGDLGFRADHVITAQVFLPSNQYPSKDPQKRLGFIDRVLEQARALPGAKSAAVISFLPLGGFSAPNTFAVEGRPQVGPGQGPMADQLVVTPGYFGTMEIPLLRGRDFTASDRDGGDRVAVISRSVAERTWGREDPIGRRIGFGTSDTTTPPTWWTVIGVVGDVRADGLAGKSRAHIYRPMAQIPFPVLAFVVRTSQDAAALARPLERAIWAVDPNQPIFKTLALQDLADESLALRRICMLLVTVFSAMAAVLAAIGIYGVVAYSVAQRTHEIGVRMALGGTPRFLLRMLLGEALWMVAPALAAGLVAGLALMRSIEGMLYGVSANDPALFCVVALGLGLMAIAASLIPARRAMRIDPMAALRQE